MSEIDELKYIIKMNSEILNEVLEKYGSEKVSKYSKERSCCYCNSSHAGSIKLGDDGWFYNCFQCRNGGDAIKIVQRLENVGYIRALEIINEDFRLGYDELFTKLKNENKELKKELRKYKNVEDLPKLEDLKDAYSFYDNNYAVKEIEKKINFIKKKRIDKSNNIIKIQKYLTEKMGIINKLLDQEGLTLVTAPTGCGKTYAIINAFLEKSKKEKDRVFAILCPNRIQNEQNAKEYGITALIGGVEIKENVKVISCVYEKLDEILNKYSAKNLTIVVDEAHELIESIDYRSKTIEKIDMASNIAYNTIHLTATGRKLKNCYKYDYEYNFEFEKKINNIGVLSIIPTQDTERTLFTLLEINKNYGIKSLVFIDGSKENLKEIGLTLSNRYKTGIITSDDKSTSLYKNIVMDSIFPNAYDVILSTKVLECGTNIKNSNVFPIQVITNPNFFNFDSVEQKFARLRSFNKQGYLIIKECEDTNCKIKDFHIIKSEMEYSLEKIIQGLKALELFRNKQGSLSSALTDSINSFVNPISNSLLTNFINYTIGENGKFKYEIDIKRMLNAAYKEYDKQFLFNLEELKVELENRVKSKEIEILFDIFDINEETLVIKEEVKNNKRLSKEKRKERKEEVKNIILEMDLNILEKYLNTNQKYYFLKTLKKDNKDIYKKIILIEKEEKELEKIKKLSKLQHMKHDPKAIIEVYEKLETQAEIDRYIKHITYAQFNNVFYAEVPSIYSSYSIIRKNFDEIKNKKGRITQRSIFSTMQELYQKNMLWQFDKQRLQDDFENFISEENKEKKNKIGKRILKKFIYEINIIYNTTKDSNGYYKIVSLKKVKQVQL